MTNLPKLDDVAQHAGVSTATASRALNRPESVRPELRRRVTDAVDELGYVAHGAARALASRKSKTVGAIVPTIDNAIFAKSIQTLQDRLSKLGYTLLLASSDYNQERERKECQTLLEKGVDALILVGEEHHPSVYRLLDNNQTPYVNIWIYNESSLQPCVGFDNASAARKLAKYLIDIGHRDIAMVAGINEGNDRAAERVSGVLTALNEHQLSFSPGYLIEKPYEIAAGRTAAKQLLSLSNPPTAIMCGNDILAMGVLFECLSRGFRVPEDISIAGFDGMDLTAHITPALTTVQIPSEEMGYMAAEYVHARISKLPVNDKTKLIANIIVRDSTSVPRSHSLR
ncbi:MAG: LacI family transcriptional regulator [Parasphingorhabdus sp.]|jgi:LacI family transcriptional regulator